jgi:hypothetical protein
MGQSPSVKSHSEPAAITRPKEVEPLPFNPHFLEPLFERLEKSQKEFSYKEAPSNTHY